MTDAASALPADGTEEGALRDDAGNPNTDRGYLLDEPPAQLDTEAVEENDLDASDDAGSAADAARD